MTCTETSPNGAWMHWRNEPPLHGADIFARPERDDDRLVVRGGGWWDVQDGCASAAREAQAAARPAGIAVSVSCWRQFCNRSRPAPRRRCRGIWTSPGIAQSTEGPSANAGATAAPKFDASDNAWVLTSAALVLMMTAPALALFYCGLVRKKNVLSVMMQCVFLMCLMTVIWACTVIRWSSAATDRGSATVAICSCAASSPPGRAHGVGNPAVSRA